MDLSVVIPCYNAESVLGYQLEALAGQEWTGAWEVIVVDNGSTDRSNDVVERFEGRFAGLRLVDASARRGQPYALNVGAREATGKAVVFVDADDVVADNWVAAMGSALARHEFVASRHDTRELNPEWLVESRGEAQREGLQTIWYPPYLPHAGGCGLGVRRYLLEKYGGFDEGLPYLHDTDLCFRLQKAGVELVFVPDATVHIRFRTGTSSMFRQARHWAEYNDLVYRRHRPDEERIPDAWREYWLSWRRIVRRLRRIRSKRVRTQLAWQAGWQIGLFMGSLKYRVEPAVWIPESRRLGPADNTGRSLAQMTADPSEAGD